MTETTSTPAETEQRAYDDTGGARGVLAIRDDQFARAPAYIPQQEEWAGLKEMARSMSVTEFVPKEMRGRPFAVLGALLTGRDLGLPPMMALRRIYVVNGRPSLEGAVKVALVRQRGHKVTVVPGEWDNEHCTVRGWRKGDSPDEVMEVTYTIDDAKQAGDYDKQGDTYKKRPRQMLYWRAAGLLCDTYFPDVTLGIPDPEEAAGMEPEVLEARFVEADRRGELPAVPPTEEEQAAREVERAAESEERLKAAMVTPPPPPPRRGGRSPKGPQPGSDSGPTASTPMAATSQPPASPPAAAPAPATLSGTPQSKPHLVSDAEMARGMGLPELADAIERGEAIPTDLQRLRAAETGSTAPEPGGTTPGAPDSEQPPAVAAPPQGDPFGDEDEAPPSLRKLIGLRKKAEDYADFLMRAKLERYKQPAASYDVLHADALSALSALSKAKFGHGYDEVSEEEFEADLLPWLRQRYATEGGKE